MITLIFGLDPVALGRQYLSIPGLRHSGWRGGMQLVSDDPKIHYGSVVVLGSGTRISGEGMFEPQHYDPVDHEKLDEPYYWTPPVQAVPDMRDPATLGAVLGVVRELWGDPNACAGCCSDGVWYMTVNRKKLTIKGETEAHILVLAAQAGAKAKKKGAHHGTAGE